MKLALNGALTIGTLDGANIEIRDAVGEENIFIFGMTAAEVVAQRDSGYRPAEIVADNAELRAVLELIASGYFSPNEPDEFCGLVDQLLHDGEHFLVLADYDAYVRCQDEVDNLYRDQDEWTRRAIVNMVNMGPFSSDRSIAEYASRIWKISPVRPE